MIGRDIMSNIKGNRHTMEYEMYTYFSFASCIFCMDTIIHAYMYTYMYLEMRLFCYFLPLASVCCMSLGVLKTMYISFTGEAPT